jgi:hypothetical protein
MNADSKQRQRRQRRAGPGCGGGGAGRGLRLSGRHAESGLGERTATRALIAVGTNVAQDLRDAEGLTRPMLRSAAIRLATSRREPARRLGYAYLRLDPPAPEALPAGVEVIDVTSASSPHPSLIAAQAESARSPGAEPAI